MTDAEPVALITGAGSGIGRAAAIELAGRGWRLVLVGRQRAPLEETAELADTECALAPGDITREGDCRAMIAAATDGLGGLDALVNNAGWAPHLPIDQTTPDIIADAFAVNAIGPAMLIQLAWPIFVRQGSGVIVNMSTLGTQDPFEGFFAYAAAKSAVNSMTRSCAKEGAAHGIRAFAIGPGAVETAMLRGIFGDSIPPENCLAPEVVATVIAECICGEREGDNGSVIWMVAGG
jgi:NAD(P)-dependent dehydrogenase (short-subunit alcohol dehydrogenase family)